MFSFRSNNQKCRLTFFPRFARRRRLYSEPGAEDKTASSDEVNVREAAGNPHERFRAVWFCHLSRSFVFVVASKKRGGGYSWCSTQKRPKTKATTKKSLQVKTRTDEKGLMMCLLTSITFPPFISSTLHTRSPFSRSTSTSTSLACARTCLRRALIICFSSSRVRKRSDKRDQHKHTNTQTNRFQKMS